MPPPQLLVRSVVPTMDEFSSKVVNTPPLFGAKLTVSMRNFLAKIAVFHFFMLEGIYDGVWSCYLPGMQHMLKISDSELGTAALFVYLGITVASPFVAYFLKQVGSKTSTYLGSIIFGLSINGMARTESLMMLMCSLFTYGWTMGIMDVSMNNAGILTEIVAGRPLLGSFHGSYSVAAAMGSVFGSILVATKWSIINVFGALSALSLVLSTIASFLMYDHTQELRISEIGAEQKRQAANDMDNVEVERGETINSGSKKMTTMSTSTSIEKNSSSNSNNSGAGGGSRWGISNTNWLIGTYSAVGFLSAFGESSMLTWSIVYFDRVLRVSPGMHGMGFTSFMVSMAAGRFGCDYLRRLVGRRLIFRTGGLLALTGLCLVVLSPSLSSRDVFTGSSSNMSIGVACIGFSITGFGLSTLIPTSFSSAGHIAGVHPGTAISIVSMFTNAGGSVSPALIGVLSDWFGSLQSALLCDALLLSLVCPLSWGVPGEDHHRREAILLSNHHENGSESESQRRQGTSLAMEFEE